MLFPCQQVFLSKKKRFLKIRYKHLEGYCVYEEQTRVSKSKKGECFKSLDDQSAIPFALSRITFETEPLRIRTLLRNHITQEETGGHGKNFDY